MAINPVQVQQYLGGLDYPADKQKLIEHATENGADSSIIQTLEALPDRDYNSPNEVTEAISGQK